MEATEYIDRINKINYFSTIQWSKVDTPRYWFKNEPLITHFFNTFSLIIPETERFIVRVLKTFTSQVEGSELSLQINQFIKEECAHTLQHTRFNADLKRQGYPVDFISKSIRKSYDFLGKIFSKKTKLAFSICFEHITVMYIRAALEKQLFTPDTSVIFDLFLWHSYEEANHRTFLIDMYQAVGGTYLRRIMGMIISTMLIFGLLGPLTFCTLVSLDIVKKRGIKFRDYKVYIQFLWSIRGCVKYYFSFYKFNFRP